MTFREVGRATEERATLSRKEMIHMEMKSLKATNDDHSMLLTCKGVRPYVGYRPTKADINRGAKISFVFSY